MAKGLAEYREGHFDKAVDWTRKAVAIRGVFDLDVQGYMVLAMAQFRLGQVPEAQAALAVGKEIFKTKMPKAGSGDLGASYHDWLIAHILMREATDLIERQGK